MNTVQLKLELSENDLSFIQTEAKLQGSTVEQLIRDAVSLYRQRVEEVDTEMGVGCCGGVGGEGCHCGN